MVEGLCLTRRVNQLARKEYRPRQSASEATGSSTEKDEELAGTKFNGLKMTRN